MIAAEETDQQHDDHFTQTEWVEAGWMYLRNEPKSDEAKALVDTILAGLPLEPARPTTVARRRVALGALLADLLRLAEEGQVGCHGMNRDDFPLKRLGFAYDIFRSLKDAMIEAGLLWFSEGRQRLTTIGPVDGSSSRITNTSGGYVSRFRLTPDALEWIAASGVFPGDWKANWKASATLQSKGEPQPERASLVLLRASSERENGTSRSGKDLKVDPSEPVVRDMLDDLEAHNAFLTAVGVTGIDFIGLRRIFNEGDIAVKRWRSGGRFYSVRVKGMGNSYETMDGEERRALIRLGGSVVGEVDMSASQLRLLYALLDADLPSDLATDPYALPGLDREAVKLVVAQALGKAQGRSTRWGKEARKGYEKKRPGRSLQKVCDDSYVGRLTTTEMAGS